MIGARSGSILDVTPMFLPSTFCADVEVAERALPGRTTRLTF